MKQIFLDIYFKSYRGLPRNCWHGIGIAFLVDMAAAACFFLSLYLVDHLHFSMYAASAIVSLYGLGKILGGASSIKLLKIFNPKITSITCILMMSLSFFSLIFIKTEVALSLAVIIIGSCFYIFSTAINVWTLSFCGDSEKSRAQVVNILYTIANLGAGAAFVVIGMLADYNFDMVFVASGLALLFAAIYFIMIGQHKVPLKNRITALVKAKDATVKPNKKTAILALACLFFMGAIMAQFWTTVPIYIHQFFPSSGVITIGLLYAINAMLIVTLQTPLSTFLMAKENKITIMGVGALLIGGGLFVLVISKQYAITFFASIIFTFGEMLFLPTAKLICYQEYSDTNKGKNLGIYQTIYGISIMIGPITGGMLYDHFNPSVLWSVIGGVGFICFISCLIYKKITITKHFCKY